MLPSQFIDVYTRFFPIDMVKAKTDLFDCFAKVPSEFYYKCFVGMLHPITQTIVSESTAQKAPTTLIKKLLFEDDINICTKSLHKMEDENHLNTPYSEREELY